MTDDPKIVGFPKVEVVPPEEMVRRQRVEAERLAGLSPGEWVLWIDASAARLGVPRAPLEALVKALVAEKEKARRERKADEERARRDAEKAATRKRQERAKSTEREFRVLAKLPEREQEARLDGLAKRLGEDPAGLREEFALATSPSAPESVELWPEAVETAALLEELTKQLRRFVVFRHALDAIAVALWAMFTWIHAVAVHSPILVASAPEKECGKSSLLGVLRWLTPRPFNSVEMTGPTLYRLVDRDRPTLFADEADGLLQRKPDLWKIINAGWTRGTKIPRNVNGVVHWFDPFCAKALACKSMALPDDTASRSIIVDLWPKLPDEKVEDFLYADAPEFQELRRKLARWSADQATTLAEAKPAFPPGFGNRLAANWKLLFAIADHAGWPAQARSAAIQISRKPPEASAGRALLETLRGLRGQDGNRESIASAAIVQALTADKDSEWCEYRGRGPITQRQVAALLRAFQIYPGTIHPTGKADASPRGYVWRDFDDAFARFLPADPHIRTRPPRKRRK